mgnify:CR=1 FL=1
MANPSASKPDTVRITEIFYSLQGESNTVGLPTVFIRLTGCPLRCGYCDTSYAFKGGDWITLPQVLAQVSAYGPRYVTVTGGEPLAQDEVVVGAIYLDNRFTRRTFDRSDLDAIEILARGCPAIITSGGLLVIEHGAEQEETVAALLKAHGWANIRCYKDYSGLPRVTSANHSETP